MCKNFRFILNSVEFIVADGRKDLTLAFELEKRERIKGNKKNNFINRKSKKEEKLPED